MKLLQRLVWRYGILLVLCSCAVGPNYQKPDVTNLTPAELTVLKDEILQVISRHIDIDSEAVQIAVEHDGRSQRLVADIPLRNVTRRRTG